MNKLRDVGKLYNFEEDVEIAEKEITALNNLRKRMGEREDVDEISLTQEEKEKERFGEKNKKLKKETERNNSKELIIGRTKRGAGVPNQIDTSRGAWRIGRRRKGNPWRRRGINS